MIGRFRQNMQFRIRQLLTNATDDWRGQHNVANGTEPNEKNLFQNTLFPQQR